MISEVLVIDDGSPETDVLMMTERLMEAFPMVPVTVNTTTPIEGLPMRMRAWHDKIEGDFVLHLQDDWEFVTQGCPILAALDVLSNNPEIGQVALSRELSLPVLATPTGTKYWLWEYDGSSEYTNPSYRTWPRYTHNPSIIRVSAIRKVGPVDNAHNSEHKYGIRWVEAGYWTAYLLKRFVQHIGEKSAFEINGTIR